MATPKACTVECSIEYFPEHLRNSRQNQSIHSDPEFTTFTYGDPTLPKRGLQRLRVGSLLVFYAGLEKWPERTDAGLYIIGYFEVANAGPTRQFPFSSTEKTLSQEFSRSPPKCLRASKTETGAHQGRYEESPSQEGHANKHHRQGHQRSASEGAVTNDAEDFWRFRRPCQHPTQSAPMGDAEIC